MGYKINIRSGMGWSNLLQDSNIDVTDTNGNFTETTLDGVLDELHEAIGSGGGGGLTAVVVSTNTTAVKDSRYMVDTTSGIITITLPATPSVGDNVGICDNIGNFGTNGVVIDGGVETIMGIDESLFLATDNKSIELTYTGAVSGWRITNTTPYYDSVTSIQDIENDIQDIENDIQDIGNDIQDLQGSAFGVGQTWQNMTASRADGVTYTNNTGKPIMVMVQSGSTTVNSPQIQVDGIRVSYFIQRSTAPWSLAVTCFAIVPNGSIYGSFSGSGSISTVWSELR